MKFLKVLLIIIGILVAAFVVTALIMPKDYNVERSIEIEASMDVVKELTFGMEAMETWSPWSKLDTAKVDTFEGEEGSVGQKHSWSGNDDVGEGYQEIVALSDNRIETKLVFIRPWESESSAYIELEELENGNIKVIWGFDGHMDFPMNVIIPTMDGHLGADFEEGLNDLKVLCENMPEGPKTYRGFAIREIEMEAKKYLAHREVVAFDKMQEFFGTHFGFTFQFTQEKQLEIKSSPSGIYFSYDEENMSADMAAGIAFAGDLAEVPEGYEIIEAGGKALHIEHYGAYDKVAEAHYAMDDYMKEKGLELNEIVVEEYVTDPTTVQDPSEILTNIYYFVK